MATIHLDLSFLFDVQAVLAGIRDGQLVALHSGHCDVTATLAIEKSEVASKQDRFTLPGVIPLNPGIRLLSNMSYTPDPGLAETLL